MAIDAWKVVRSCSPIVTDLGRFKIPLSYKNIDHMIYDGGYDIIHKAITPKRFKITRYGWKSLYSIQFRRAMESEEVEHFVRRMYDKALAPIEDLLIFGCNLRYRDVQRTQPVICLGSSVERPKGIYVPFLEGDEERRDLCLGSYYYGWPEESLFLLTDALTNAS